MVDLSLRQVFCGCGGEILEAGCEGPSSWKEEMEGLKQTPTPCSDLSPESHCLSTGIVVLRGKSASFVIGRMVPGEEKT